MHLMSFHERMLQVVTVRDKFCCIPILLLQCEMEMVRVWFPPLPEMLQYKTSVHFTCLLESLKVIYHGTYMSVYFFLATK
jgi:hypothetical protein